MPPPARRWPAMAEARAAKRPAFAGLRLPAAAPAGATASRSGSGLLEGLDVGAQAALVAGGLVLVDQATGRGAVEDRLGGGGRGLGAGGVLGLQGLEDLLHGGAQHRALAGVAGVADQGLLGALLGGLDVGHGGLLETVLETALGMVDSGRPLRGRPKSGDAKTANYGGFK